MPGLPPTATPWEPHQPPGHTSVQRDILPHPLVMLVPSGLNAMLGRCSTPGPLRAC